MRKRRDANRIARRRWTRCLALGRSPAWALGLSLALCADAGVALARDPNPPPVQPASPPDMGQAALIQALAPPPPPAIRTTAAAPVCPPAEQPSPVPWIITGISVLGMALTSVWALVQYDRTRVIRSELTRIRMRRTSTVRVTKPLDEHSTDLLASNHFPLTHPPGAGPEPDEQVYEAPEVREARRQADALLAGARAHLEPLMTVVDTVEDHYADPAFEALLAEAGESRRAIDRLRRRVLACAGGFSQLRTARIAPGSVEEVPQEIERYWEQVYGCIDDLFEVFDLMAGRETRQALDSLPGFRAMNEHPKRLLSAARDYLGSQGRLLIDVELTRTDVDRRLHRVVEERIVPGVPAGKVVAVVRCGITREGRLARRPEVVASI